MRLFAEYALLPSGWARDIAVSIDGEGTIVAVEREATPGVAERARGPLLPGMPNVHSHAFQRAIAGRTGQKSAAGADSFWTWREAMYVFLDVVDADAFEAITAQAYVEMLEAGYTSVAEFHYVHHDRDGRPYANPAELAQRVIAAAQSTGIALTLLPVFYAHSTFNGAAPTAGQRRFVHTPDGFARTVAALADTATGGELVLGVAPHSLRAVTPGELGAILANAPEGPIHIHAAEQAREVEECVAALGAPPVQWLLDHAGVDERWCLVHATHMTAHETRRLAASGAVAGVAPTTEADLGDGIFAARAFVDSGGTIGIGTDSNTVIDPFIELRQLEWSQRLALRERNVLARDGAPVGQSLYAMAAAGGAKALAQPVGAIREGRRADLAVLDTNDPALADQRIDDILDAAIFGPCRRRVRDAMVAGRWLVRDGQHTQRETIMQNYRAALARIARH